MLKKYNASKPKGKWGHSQGQYFNKTNYPKTKGNTPSQCGINCMFIGLILTVLTLGIPLVGIYYMIKSL